VCTPITSGLTNAAGLLKTLLQLCPGYIKLAALDTGIVTRRSIIEESEDQDASRMQAKLDFVAIDQLAKYIGNKVSRCCRAVAASWTTAVALDTAALG